METELWFFLCQQRRRRRGEENVGGGGGAGGLPQCSNDHSLISCSESSLYITPSLLTPLLFLSIDTASLISLRTLLNVLSLFYARPLSSKHCILKSHHSWAAVGSEKVKVIPQTSQSAAVVEQACEDKVGSLGLYERRHVGKPTAKSKHWNSQWWYCAIEVALW